MDEKERQVTITDEKGEERLMEVLFTYDNPERKTSYVFIYDPATPEEIIALRYKDDGTLEPIEDDDEYAEVEEVFNAFMEDPKIQEAKKDK